MSYNNFEEFDILEANEINALYNEEQIDDIHLHLYSIHLGKRIEKLLSQLNEKIKTMATGQQISDAVDAITAAWTTETGKIISEIQVLQAQIAANGNNIDPTTLDAPLAKLQSLQTAISGFDPEAPAS